jgi:hypothetical protein
MSHPDYYADARDIAAKLFERGEFDWSERIEDAISGGSTATEILMRVRFCLRQLVESGTPRPDEKQAAQELIGTLDDVLR